MAQEPESQVHHLRGFLARVHLPGGRGVPPKRRYLLLLIILLAIVLVIGFIGIYRFGASQSKTMTPYTLAISTALSGPQKEGARKRYRGCSFILPLLIGPAG